MSNTVPSATVEGIQGRDHPPSSSATRSDSTTSKARTPTQPNLSQRLTTTAQVSSQNVNRGRGHEVRDSSPSILPPEKVFPIQIGSELFRLSGASISSDAPSYFSQFFEEQIKDNNEGGGIRTLYIDRDPVTFRDIAKHLQGYHVRPHDGAHFVKLFADAQFYSLPKLISQLFESEIFIQIGHRHFQIPRDIFAGPGDSPNFFSLGFAVFFSTPGEAFPGLDRRGLLRPPTIIPPSVPNRSADVFAQLLHLLRGYTLHIRNEDHRQELLRDCRYFHLRGLEQKLIACEISYNLERQRSEICIRLEDVRPSGISFVNDIALAETPASGGWVNYARPFVDESAYELIIEITGESMVIDLHSMRADFHGLTKARVASLSQVISNKLNLPNNAPLGLMMLSGGASTQAASPGNTPLSEDQVKIWVDEMTDVTLNNEPFEVPSVRSNEIGSTCMAYSEPDTGAHGDAIPDNPRRSSSRMNHPSPSQNPDEQISYLGAGKRPGSLSVPGSMPPNKRQKQRAGMEESNQWTIHRGLWRLRVQVSPNPIDINKGGLELVMVAVKLEAFSSQRARNAHRGFLG